VQDDQWYGLTGSQEVAPAGAALIASTSSLVYGVFYNL